MNTETCENTPEQRQRQSVKSAALMLDQLVPGWYRYIKPAELKMSNCSLCTLGQLFGSSVETGIAKVLYSELWKEKWAGDGFRTALWGYKGYDNYSTGMLHDICESKGLDFETLYSPTRTGSAFGMSQSLRCLWAEEAAERLANDVIEDAAPDADDTKASAAMREGVA